LLNDVRYEADARLLPDEVNTAYAWVEWPQRETWRLEAVNRSCIWFAARDLDGQLIGVARLQDDGGLDAAVWDLIVRPDRQRQGIGSTLLRMVLERCADRHLVAVVSTPAAIDFFRGLGFVPESHGHVGMYLRPRVGHDQPV
jgi:GNAT superfamily N-acetyltransferase